MKQCETIEICLVTGEPLSDVQLDHLRECEVCSAVAAENDQLNNALQDTLALDVPADLQRRLQQIPWQKGRLTSESRFNSPLKIAASVVLVVGLLTAVYWHQKSTDSWDQVVYEHLMHEPEALHLARVVDKDVVSHLAGEFGMKLDAASLGDVNYVTLCPIAGTQSLHLVFQGKTGPVTLLYMPGKHIEKSLSFTRERFNGRIKNLDAGVIALVGEDDEPMTEIENRVRESLTWL